MEVNRLLCNTVMLVVRCHHEDAFVLTQIGSRWFVPFRNCIEDSWKNCVTELYIILFGLEPSSQIVMHTVYRIWRGDGQPALENIVFHVDADSTILKPLNSAIYANAKWLKKSEIKQLIDNNEIHPEMKRFLNIPFIYQNEFQSSLQNCGNLIETSKGDVSLNRQNPTLLDTMIMASEFSDEEITMLYDLFIKATFPNLTMDLFQFNEFINYLGILQFSTEHFISADLYNNSIITFKEVLAFISATNINVGSWSGVSAEQRCKYIFRLYDRDQDKRLSSDEFSQMLDDVAVVKKTLIDKQALLNHLKNTTLTVTEFVNLVVSKIIIDTTFLMVTTADIHDILQHFGNRTKNVGNYTLAKRVVTLSADGTIMTCNIHEHIDQYGSGNSEDLINKSSNENCEIASPAASVLKALKYFSDNFSVKSAVEEWWEPTFDNFYDNLVQCCNEACTILESEPRLISINSPVYIIGDIHGNFSDIMAFEKWFWGTGFDCSPCAFLFLGDYVDRGLNSVEVAAYLIAHKVKTPSKVILLRGNHETRKVQKEFTFHGECVGKFGDKGLNLWNSFNDVFDRLPLAAIVDNEIFCCHGGIPMPSLFECLDDINKINCPLQIPSQNTLAWALLWNDPQRSDSCISGTNPKDKGFTKNTRRKTGHMFDSIALETFIEKHKLSYVVRAHEYQNEGFRVSFNDKLITVFSSSNYAGNNKAGCVLAQGKKLRIFIICQQNDPDPNKQENDEKKSSWNQRALTDLGLNDCNTS